MSAESLILTIFGTRPEAIKMGPVIEALRADGNFIVRTLATAQHRDMLDAMLEVFRIVPDHDLNVMTVDQRLADLTARCIVGIDAVLKQEKPRLALVQGDTTTVLASALACHYNRIPLGHVEAGLRTNDRYAPFPEEMNRRIAGALADLHFAPTRQAESNLLREGVLAASIHVTGNTVVDAVQRIAQSPEPTDGACVDLWRFADRTSRLILVTAHRRESFGAPLREVCWALRDIADAYPDAGIAFPVHPNPNVNHTVTEILAGHPGILLLRPLNYIQFVHAMKRAYLLLTDSGGVQEEAPSLGKPVLVLREKSERPEGIQAGLARLVGTDRSRIVRETSLLLDSPAAYAGMVAATNPYGDGRAAERIVTIIKAFLGVR